MRKKFFKHAVSFAILTFIAVSVFTFASIAPVNADENSLYWGNQMGNIASNIGLGNTDPRVMISRVINVILGFLGIIAVILILIGGFKWMTAGGNEEKATESLTLIRNGFIGLIIVLAAWAIAKLVMNIMYSATTIAE